MKNTNTKLGFLADKIKSGDKIKVAILGLGSVGNYLLTYLLEMADENMEIVVVGRNEERLKKDLNIARVAASIRGKLVSEVSTYAVDFDKVDEISKFFNDEKPDFVVNSSRAYSGVKYGSISWKNIRAYGIWSPLSISVIKNIMVAHKNAKSNAIVINTSYSDSVNAWLKSAGLNYPDFGSGNLNHLIPRIKFAIKDMLNLTHDDVIDITIATSHFHGVSISSEGITDGVDPLLNIKVNNEDIKVNHQELYKRCAITMPSDQKRNMMNASSNWEIIHKILTSLRENKKLTLHSPGVFGNIGGFPVIIDGSSASMSYGEKYFSYEDMAKNNRDSIYLDGIEDVKDATLIYTDELVQKVKDVFDVDLPKKVHFDEIENIATLLIEKIIKPNI
ncbi:MAG TPA: hypothetical protein EYG74_03515 [Sulfurimonas autotrophica]|nr:hypothetical protein [Sulfurimonas autotrophica]